jgi:hypothetical protein
MPREQEYIEYYRRLYEKSNFACELYSPTLWHASYIADFIQKTACKGVLDYSCGRACV